ncbi:MAG: MATE family efflux transporter [Alphaproteobacteria bacterium]|nr:MATE family efflux transporter [Alphaproteobacteria bacterium]
MTISNATPSIGPQPFDVPAWRAELRALLKLAGPLVATQVAQFAVLTADLVMIGRLGTEALAATSLGVTLYFMGWIFTMGPAVIVSALIARSLGADRDNIEDVRATLRMSVWAVALVGVPMIGLLALAEPFLLLIGQKPHLAAEAAPYALALAPGLIFALVLTILRNFAACLDKPMHGLYAAIGVTLINIALNYVLIYGHFGAPALGVLGAGIASTAANFLGVAGFIAWLSLAEPFRRYRITRDFWTPDWPRLAEVLRLGLPVSASLVFEGGFFNVSIFLMGLFSAAALAAHQIAVNVASLTFMVPLGVGMATVVRVGLMAGGGDAPGARRAGFTGIGVGGLFMGLCALVLFVMPETILGFYLDVDDPQNAETIAAGVVFLRIAAFFQIFDALQVTAAQALRGFKDTFVPMLFAGLAYWGIGLPLSVVLAFPAGLGGAGIWFSFVAALIVAAALMVWRFHVLSLRPAPGPLA